MPLLRVEDDERFAVLLEQSDANGGAVFAMRFPGAIEAGAAAERQFETAL